MTLHKIPKLCSAIFILCCTGLLSAQAEGAASCSPAPCRLGSALTLSVAGQQSGVNKDNAQTLELVLDGRVMTGVKARGPLQPGKDGKGSVLIFDLNRQPANKDAWNALLTAGYKRNITAGVSNGKPVDGVNATVFFDAIPSWWWAIALTMGAILVGFIALAIRSDILRDGPSLPNGTKLSFSLGRTQMAWWTFINACSFLYIWIVTWDWTFLPPSALVLMGISAATTLGAQLVDRNRNQRRQALLDQQRTRSNRLDQINVALRASPPNAADLQTERTQKQAQLDDVNSSMAQLPPDFGPSENFLADILRDDEGVSLHRFQLALWTLILGIVFVVQVLRSLSIPEFNDTLLALMGISAGTYVGFKIPDPPKQS